MKNNINIHIAADHRGYCFKYDLKQYLFKKGFNVLDHGNHRYQADDDFPIYGQDVCKAVLKDKNSLGILICGSGAGMNILANKTKCIRSAVCWNHQVAEAVKRDDNPQILVIPADFMSKKEAKKTIWKFIKTPASTKIRHIRRLKQILKYEKCSNAS